MSSIFSGLNVASRALQTHKRAVDVTSHNIANANTEGFSRQRPVFSTATPQLLPGVGHVGNGVEIEGIERVRDGFLDRQVRNEKQYLGYWESRQEALGQIETLAMEPTETGFNQALEDFFDAWQELSINPGSSPVRTTLMENSQTLTNTVSHLNGQLDNLEEDGNKNIEMQIEEINNLVNNIANTNQQIANVKNRGETPNDLMDQRDLLVDKLSEIIDFSVTEFENGSINIKFRGQDLVRESMTNELIVDYENGGELQIYLERDGEKHGSALEVFREHSYTVNRDTLEGLISARDEVANFQKEFNSVIDSMAQLINEQHGEGYDLHGNAGENYFVQDNLGNWSVNEEIVSDVGKIAVAQEIGGEEGDGLNALEIGELRNTKLTKTYVIEVEENGEITEEEIAFEDIEEGQEYAIRYRKPEGEESGQAIIEDVYRNLISSLGVKTGESQKMVENQETLLNELLNKRESVSGVSLDEEMSNMILFQRGYQAASRVVTTLDEMLDTIVNRMGIT